jgi:hypothetical protein
MEKMVERRYRTHEQFQPSVGHRHGDVNAAVAAVEERLVGRVKGTGERERDVDMKGPVEPRRFFAGRVRYNIGKPVAEN